MDIEEQNAYTKLGNGKGDEDLHHKPSTREREIEAHMQNSWRVNKVELSIFYHNYHYFYFII